MEPVLHRAALLRAAGYGDDDVRRLRRRGVLTSIRRGAYADRVPGPVARHGLLLRAALAELAVGAVASHVSAAVVHGLPTWGLALDRAHVTFARRTGGRRDSRLHVHTAPLHPDDVVVVDGLAATSPARTVVDVARCARFEPAVAVVDAALRIEPGSSPLVTRAELDAALRRAKGWPGVPAARRVVAFADGRAESVGESRSRVAIALAGLPPPELQWPVRLAAGTAWTDFAWPDRRTVGEFDGKVKYGRLLRPGQEPGDAVYAEKLREDGIRAESWDVVRWTWADLDGFAPVAARLRDRLRP